MSKSAVWTESLWKKTFDKLLEDEEQLDPRDLGDPGDLGSGDLGDRGDTWKLKINYSLPEKITKEKRKLGWKIYSHCAFGKFQCRNCRKTWTSARVVVMFRYQLLNGNGTVIMHPFAQACRRCKDEFQLPGFSQEEVELGLRRLFSKIRKNCYYDENEKGNGSPTGSTKVTKPHEKTLCLACHRGMCCEDNKKKCV